MSIARDHHYIPQFYLRNFAVDPEKKKVTTVAKHGPIVVWSKRSIEGLGYERDLYVSLSRGVPISIETTINERIETPISRAERPVAGVEAVDAGNQRGAHLLVAGGRGERSKAGEFGRAGIFDLLQKATAPLGAKPLAHQNLHGTLKVLLGTSRHVGDDSGLAHMRGARFDALALQLPAKSRESPVDDDRPLRGRNFGQGALRIGTALRYPVVEDRRRRHASRLREHFSITAAIRPTA